MRGKQIMIVGVMFTVMIFSSVSFMGKIGMLMREQRDFEDLKTRIVITSQKSETDITKVFDGKGGEEKKILPEFRELYRENKDFCGWLTLEGTRIDYPVMQSLSDREFYLHRDFYGKDSYAGVPFIGNGDVGTDNGDLFIYGHNMKNGTMFADLLNYCNKEYWEEHSVIQLDTLWDHKKYDIFTVLYANEDDWSKEDGLFYSEVNGIEMDKVEYLNKLKSVGLYETNIMPGDIPVLFLVTCSYQEKNGRMVLVGTLKREKG